MITLDEAIEILSRPKTMKGTPQDILEAHDMAITALELFGNSEQLPSAQPEIIRCRECKYNDMPPTAGNAGCTLLYGMTNQNGFCSLAERREVSE